MRVTAQQLHGDDVDQHIHWGVSLVAADRVWDDGGVRVVSFVLVASRAWYGAWSARSTSRHALLYSFDLVLSNTAQRMMDRAS